MKNSTLSRLIRTLNALEGVKCVKFHGSPYAESGQPDLFIVANGRPILIEIKHGRAQLTPIQRKRAEEWESAGALVAACRSADEVLALVYAGPLIFDLQA